MKYWLLTTEFPPIHGGGISTYCWHTAKMMAAQGHVVTIFINDNDVSSFKEEYPTDNVKLIRFNPNQVEIGKALGYEARLSLEFSSIVEKEIIKEGIPDILETQDYLGIGYYTLQKKLLLYKNFKELKVVLTMHAPNFLYLDYNQVPLYNFPDYWTGEMEKASIKMADLVISPSNYLIEELKSRIDFETHLPTRIFNPFITEDNSPASYNNGDIVFFGKLTPQKGAIEMLSYLKKMWDKGFDKPISIIGGGNHLFYPVGKDLIDIIKEKYQSYIQKGLISFEGNMPPEKLIKRLEKAHVIITPSIVDNLPYAVLEAMSMGKIVLGSTNSGHTEVITNKKNGFIFDHKIPGDFETSLLNILSIKKEELLEIGEEAKKRVKQLTNYDIVYNQKIKVLNNLIEKQQEVNVFPFIERIEKNTQNITQIKTAKTDLLSVVIPYYNMGKFIEDTLKSASKITYPNYEIIVVNDGSDCDLSIKKIEELKSKYKFTLYNKENEGLSLTRNFGAEKAQGCYLAFLDADDTVNENYYNNSIEVLEKYDNVSFVGCWAQYFGESTDIWPTFNPEPPYLLTHNMINSSALVYKKDHFLQYGKNDSKLIYGMEDYDSVISMVKNGARGVAFPEIWWNYRIRKNSMAQSFTKNKELYLYRLISKKHQTFFNMYASEIANLLNHNGSGIFYNNPTSSNKVSAYRFLPLQVIALIKRNKGLRIIAKKAYQLLKN
ncbi:glycosyltransferase [bacterium]|nr:glycosyltransferase [bacterium]